MSNNQLGEAKKISREMRIEEVFNLFPAHAQRFAQIMQNAGLHCVGCQAATWETIETGVQKHGFSEEDLEKLLAKLNAILEEKVDFTQVTLTEKAAQKYLEILKEEAKEGYGVRLMEKSGGCGGFEYSLDYSEKAKENDEVFLSRGIEIHVDREMLERLLGSEVDYLDGLHGSGFKVSNPNVKSSCHCGTSHGY